MTVDPTSLTMDEGGASDSYTVSLNMAPTGDVTVTIGGASGTDLDLDKSTLTFTTINWETSQTVTVTAGQDDDAVEDSVTLTHTVTGGGYDGVTAADVAVTVTDDDTVGVSVSESSLDLDEGDDGTYTVVPGHPARRGCHRDGGRTFRDRRVPGQDHTHLHHHQLEHSPDGDGHRGT